jgi:hypothetical protein
MGGVGFLGRCGDSWLSIDRAVIIEKMVGSRAVVSWGVKFGSWWWGISPATAAYQAGTGRWVFGRSQDLTLHYVCLLVAADTVSFFRHCGPIRLKEHVSVDGKFLPSGNTVRPMAKLLDRLTVGSVWSGNNIRLSRQEGAMLTSVDNFWSGHVGGQTF